MRFTSLCAVLGAALLPVASAAPCRPSKPTSALETTATTTAASETSAVVSETGAATTIESSATYASTSVIDITLTETATPTEITSTGFTTLVTSTAESTVSEDATTTADATTTVAEEAGPSNFVHNGGFEDTSNTDWVVRTAEIKESRAKARSGKRYAELKATNSLAVGGNHINQTINGLDTKNIYRLTFYVTVLDEQLSVGNAICSIEAIQGSELIQTWRLEYDNLGEYVERTVDFIPVADGFEFDLRLRCTQENKVTLTVALDDVSITDQGPAPAPTN
ncbi:Ff.00g100990.m01.CDS01 [Fusarium sp. VM40]|nr:Ff.00g100990.m01.CDS01 [Fusarium sp. VM40]